MTLQAGGWILKTPFALVIIFAGLMFDNCIRMVITLGSQYYRLISLPEASFGLIGSGLAVLGLIIPRLAHKMVNRHSPVYNLGSNVRFDRARSDRYDVFSTRHRPAPGCIAFGGDVSEPVFREPLSQPHNGFSSARNRVEFQRIVIQFGLRFDRGAVRHLAGIPAAAGCCKHARAKPSRAGKRRVYRIAGVVPLVFCPDHGNPAVRGLPAAEKRGCTQKVGLIRMIPQTGQHTGYPFTASDLDISYCLYSEMRLSRLRCLQASITSCSPGQAIVQGEITTGKVGCYG